VPPIKKFLLKSGLVAFLVGTWLFFFPVDYAHATDSTQSEQVVVSTPTALETATATIQIVEATITNLETSTAQIQTVLSIVSQPSETLTATVQQANTALQTANTALDSATAKVDTATATLISAGLETATATTIASNLSLQETTTAQAQTTYNNNKAISDAANTTQTVTETFNNNAVNTDMVITIGASPVSTTNQNGVFISTNYAGQFGMTGSNMTVMNPSVPITIDLPSNKTITEFGFTAGAKNGTVNATVTYTDGTTTTMEIIDNCNFSNCTNVNSVTASSGKIIDRVAIPVDYDYYLIDNLYYKVIASDPTKTATTAASLQILNQEQYELMVLQGAQTKLTEATTAVTEAKTATEIARNKVTQAKIAAVTAALPEVEDKLDSVAQNTSYLISVSDTATAAIISAETKLTLAQTALDSATAAMNTAIALKADAQTVEAATALVAQRQAEFNAAKSIVDSNTQSGLLAQVYSVNGQNASPTLSANAQPMVTTTVPNINFNWGSGQVLGGYSEDVIVKFTGQWTPNTTGTQYVYAPADDGVRLYLDGELVIDDWIDKGGGGSTADVVTTAGVSKEFEFWYYENGGGANVSFNRYTNNGDWEVVPGNEFARSTATAQQKANLADATINLSTAQTTLQTANTAQNAVNSAESLVQTAVTKTIEAITAVNTAYSLVDAEMIIAPPQNLTASTTTAGSVVLTWEAPTTGVEPERYAIFFDNDTSAGWGIATGNAGDENALDTTVTLAQYMFEYTGGLDSTYDFSVRSDQDTLQMYSLRSNTVSVEVIDVERVAAEEAARIAAEQAAAKAAADAAAAKAAADAAAAKAAADAAAISAANAAAAAQAAQAEAAKAEADRVAAEQAAAQAEAEAQQAEADRIAAEQAAAEAEAEAQAQQEAEAKAEAERLEAEAEAARQAEENAKAEAEAAEAEAEAARQAEEDAKAEAEAKEAELEKAKAEEEKAQAEEEAALAEEEKLNEILEDAKEGKELTEEQKEVVVEALLEDLKPGEAVTAAAVIASGVSYADLPPSTPVELRTDENGNALIITAEVAANIELVQDPGALLEAAFTDPGAALAALGSIGADMTEAEREEATDMVVATVVAAGAAINAAAVAAGGATGGSTGGGGSSGGGSGSNSPGSRGGRRW
jgi:hypothetical protein